jgi:aldehyde dehydrogenase (NAD+)
MSVPTPESLAAEVTAILARLGVGDLPQDGDLVARTPITGGELARLRSQSAEEVADTVAGAAEAFRVWRTVPAPVRGNLVRELGELLREHKADLGALVSIEAGKIRSEGWARSRR